MADHPSDRAIAQAFAIESECRELYDERASKFILHVLGRARALDAAPADPINPPETDSKLIVPAECWRRAVAEAYNYSFEAALVDGDWSLIEQRAIELAREGRK